MHDHKGTLHVNWTEAPRTEQLVEVVRLWRAQAEHQSSHYVNGKLLIADYESDNPFEDRLRSTVPDSPAAPDDIPTSVAVAGGDRVSI